jgi:hypothetical protein
MSKTAYSFLWKFVPGFAAQHDVTRSLFLVAFSSSILASFGLSFLNDKFTSKFDKKIIITIYICIIIIILLELNIGLNFFQGNKDISFDFRKQISENYLLKNLSIDSGLFRIHNIGTNAIGGAAGSYAIPLKLQILYGYNNVWITDYFNEYLGIAHQSPTKFYGMLNTRWIYYNQELNVSGLRFVKKFDECQSCYDGDIDSGVDGPYLYYNEQYLPRAYLVDDAILILGDEKDVKKVGYYLMLDDNFDPSNNVIIFGKKSLKDYSLEYLKRFKIIVLSGSSITNVGDKEIAKNFVYSGGYIFPDITQEHFSSDTKDLIDALKKLKDKDKKESYKSVNEINITYYTPNRISFDTNNLRGFLVISEKFAMFDGWKTKNLEKEILRADGINSAIYLDGSEDIIEVLYKPKTFIYGSILFFITIICLIIYFIIDYRNKNRIDKNE